MIAIAVIESFFNWVWLVYLIPFSILFYVFFCRYCCVVLITEYDFTVHYMVPWKKDVVIKINDLVADLKRIL